jgi:acyl carrier protein
MNAVPQNIEVLIRKAAVDDEFRALLIKRRTAAADAIGLTLEPAEAMMLRSVPAAQLEKIIGETTVPQEHRRAFLGHAAAAMLAAMATMGATVEAAGKIMPAPGGVAPGPGPTRGIQPDRPVVTFGIQPDRPSPTAQQVAAIVVRHFNANDGVKPETTFAKDLRATLLQMEALEEALNKQFEITLSAEAFWRSKTVGQLGAAVEKAVADREQSAPR